MFVAIVQGIYHSNKDIFQLAEYVKHLDMIFDENRMKFLILNLSVKNMKKPIMI